MTETGVDERSSTRAWRLAPSTVFGALGAVGVLVAGVMFARIDVVAVAMALALWAILAMRMRPGSGTEIVLAPAAEEDGWLHDEVRVVSDAEIVEVAMLQSGRTGSRVFVPGGAVVRTRSRVLHSGPARTVLASARSIAVDGGLLGETTPVAGVTRTVQPALVGLPALPLAPRLTGLNGSHDGTRAGQGGDFRDIHPFAPGDELRRVDWKATARAARRPGDLLVRRTNSLSDVSAVIVMDTADELGTAVLAWGANDDGRSGITSLDHARSAARSIAATTIGAGDRVAFHTLVHGGRSVRSGAGTRHLARLVAEISASGRAGDDAKFRRTPPVPQGSIIYVLSTFFDGAAAEIALQWGAVGHRVVAIDTLPELDRRRLTEDRELALEVLLAERQDMLHELNAAGVASVRWSDGPAEALAVIARTRAAAVVGGSR